MPDTEFEKKKIRHASGESAVSTVSDYIPTPPDGGFGWVIVFASFVNHIIVDGIAFTFGVFYMEFLSYFGESKGKTALVGSLLCGCYLMTGPIAGALTNKFGCRPVCVTGGVIATSAFVLCTFSPNLDVLILTYGVLGGFGFGLIYLPSVISVSYYFEKRRAVATGIAVCGAGVGCFIFAPVGRILLEVYDWKNAMLIVAGVTMNSIVMGMLMRPLEPPPRKTRPRRKNVLDRLREQTKLKHSDSIEAPGTKKDAINKVLEVKAYREEMLRAEDGASEYGSVPSSTMNSVLKIDRQDSRNFTKPIGIPRQENHARFNVPNSLGSEAGSPLVPHTMPAMKLNTFEDNHEIPDERTSMLRSESALAETPQSSEPQTPCTGAGDAQPSLLTANGQAMATSPTHQGSNTSLPKMSGCASIPPTILLQRIQDVGSPASVPAEIDKAGTEAAATVENGLQHPQNGTHLKVKSMQDIWAVKAQRRQRNKASVAGASGVIKSDYARPMYRKDIFYSGSILQIPQFQSQPNVKSYLMSTTTIPQDAPLEEESCLWKCCPKSIRDILKTMLDLEILKDPVFLVAAIGNAFGMLGLYVPFVFMADRSIMLGIPENHAAFLLSVIGITNTLGRVLAGAMADLKWVNPLLLHNIAILAGGISCILNMFASEYISMCVFSAFFGMCVATWISLTSIILCNMLGLEKLTNAFGLLTLVRGVCSVAGPPLAGAVFDATNDYNMSFTVGGAMLIVAGLFFCLLHLPFFRDQANNELLNENLPLPDDLRLDDEMDDLPFPDEMNKV